MAHSFQYFVCQCNVTDKLFVHVTTDPIVLAVLAVSAGELHAQFVRASLEARTTCTTYKAVKFVVVVHVSMASSKGDAIVWLHHAIATA